MRPNQVTRTELHNVVVDAARAGRTPVKTRFTYREKNIVKHFIRREKRQFPRKESLLCLCDLLGERLTPSNWERLYACMKIPGPDALDFLVGGHDVRPLRQKTDWTNKCFGLKKVERDVFVVGLNQIFYDNVDSDTADSLPPD